MTGIKFQKGSRVRMGEYTGPWSIGKILMDGEEIMVSFGL